MLPKRIEATGLIAIYDDVEIASDYMPLTWASGPRSFHMVALVDLAKADLGGGIRLR